MGIDVHPNLRSFGFGASLRNAIRHVRESLNGKSPKFRLRSFIEEAWSTVVHTMCSTASPKFRLRSFIEEHQRRTVNLRRSKSPKSQLRSFIKETEDMLIETAERLISEVSASELH